MVLAASQIALTESDDDRQLQIALRHAAER